MQTAALIAALMDRARTAQSIAATYTQAQVDQLCLAAGWAIMEPARNRSLAEQAVRETGLGNVADKVSKNHRKTLGLLRDIQGAISVGVLSDNPATGITEIARPIGVVAAITPSTNPGATPANQIINALKGGNAIILAPSPKGYGTAQALVEFVHAEFARLDFRPPNDLVQLLPAPITKDSTYELLRQADLIAATGSQANIRAAYSSGRPALGVGAGNVASIIDLDADLDAAAARIAQSKTFDHATSCSSENSLVVLDALFAPMIDALAAQGGVRVAAQDKPRLQAALWPQGKLSATLIAQSAASIGHEVGLPGAAQARFWLVEETGTGPDCPFSGEKLSPVLTLYRAKDFADACRIVAAIYAYQGAGHSVGYHGHNAAHILHLGQHLPVARVIVNQAHAIATGGSFDNGLPFSLSMGCGSWGGNSFTDNMSYRHFINITRISRPISAREPSVDEVFAGFVR